MSRSRWIEFPLVRMKRHYFFERSFTSLLPDAEQNAKLLAKFLRAGAEAGGYEVVVRKYPAGLKYSHGWTVSAYQI